MQEATTKVNGVTTPRASKLNRASKPEAKTDDVRPFKGIPRFGRYSSTLWPRKLDDRGRLKARQATIVEHLGDKLTDEMQLFGEFEVDMFASVVRDLECLYTGEKSLDELIEDDVSPFAVHATPEGTFIIVKEWPNKKGGNSSAEIEVRNAAECRHLRYHLVWVLHVYVMDLKFLFGDYAQQEDARA